MDKFATLTRKETAQMCNVSLPTLDSFMHRNDNPLPYIKAGRKYVIPRSLFLEWLEAEAQRQMTGGADK